MKKRGPAPRIPDPRDKRIAELERAAAPTCTALGVPRATCRYVVGWMVAHGESAGLAEQPDLGEESGRDGLDVHVHDPSAERPRRRHPYAKPMTPLSLSLTGAAPREAHRAGVAFCAPRITRRTSIPCAEAASVMARLSQTLRVESGVALCDMCLVARRTWGGLGVGADCAVCGVSVTHDEMELEIQIWTAPPMWGNASRDRHSAP